MKKIVFLFRFLYRYWRLRWFLSTRYRGLRSGAPYRRETAYKRWKMGLHGLYPFPFGILFPLSWLPSRYRSSEVYNPLSFRVSSDFFGWVLIVVVLYVFYYFISPVFRVDRVDPLLNVDPLEYTSSFGITPAVLQVADKVAILSTPVPDLDYQLDDLQIYPKETVTLTPEPDIQVYELSFYDPLIGRYYPEIASINCAEWRDTLDGGTCVSLLTNGDSFRDWYGHGAACPPGLEIGQRFIVVNPDFLRGDWECVDRGGGVEGRLIDFLLDFPDHPAFAQTGWNLDRFPWRSPVELYFVE